MRSGKSRDLFTGGHHPQYIQGHPVQQTIKVVTQKTTWSAGGPTTKTSPKVGLAHTADTNKSKGPDCNPRVEGGPRPEPQPEVPVH